VVTGRDQRATYFHLGNKVFHHMTTTCVGRAQQVQMRRVLDPCLSLTLTLTFLSRVRHCSNTGQGWERDWKFAFSLFFFTLFSSQATFTPHRKQQREAKQRSTPKLLLIDPISPLLIQSGSLLRSAKPKLYIYRPLFAPSNPSNTHHIASTTHLSTFRRQY
jgi:hypothetical protein